MKTASVFVQGKLAGRLEELEPGRKYRFIYQTGQSGNVWSPRYRDMAAEWKAVRYRPLKLTPDKWVSTLRVVP